MWWSYFSFHSVFKQTTRTSFMTEQRLTRTGILFIISHNSTVGRMLSGERHMLFRVYSNLLYLNPSVRHIRLQQLNAVIHTIDWDNQRAANSFASACAVNRTLDTSKTSSTTYCTVIEPETPVGHRLKHIAQFPTTIPKPCYVYSTPSRPHPSSTESRHRPPHAGLG